MGGRPGKQGEVLGGVSQPFHLAREKETHFVKSDILLL